MDISQEVIDAVAASTPAPPDPFQMELRGYEVARLSGGRWVPTAKFRPSEAGLNQALQDAAWLNDRHPGMVYTVRPIVSMLPPQGPQVVAANVVTDGPLVLEEDPVLEPSPE